MVNKKKYHCFSSAFTVSNQIYRERKMINVIASIQIKDGQLNKFIEIFKSNVANVLNEKGCLGYMPTVDFPTGLAPQELNKDVVTIIEKWENLEDLQVHLTAPHMLSYREKVKTLVEGVSFKVLEEV